MKFGFCIQAGDDPYGDRKIVRLWLSLWRTWSWCLWEYGASTPDILHPRQQVSSRIQMLVKESVSESVSWDRTFYLCQNYFRPRPHPAMAQEEALIEWCGIGYFLALVLPVLIFGGVGLLVSGIAATLVVCAANVGRMKPIARTSQ